MLLPASKEIKIMAMYNYSGIIYYSASPHCQMICRCVLITYSDRTIAFITSLYAAKRTPATGQTIQVNSQRMVTKLQPR